MLLWIVPLSRAPEVCAKHFVFVISGPLLSERSSGESEGSTSPESVSEKLSDSEDSLEGANSAPESSRSQLSTSLSEYSSFAISLIASMQAFAEERRDLRGSPMDKK